MTRSMGPGAQASDLRRAQRAIDQLRAELSRVDARARGFASEDALAALQAEVDALGAAAAVVVPVTDTDTHADLGILYFGSDPFRLYSVYGQDGAWQAYRWDGTTRDTVTGTGSMPSSVAELEALSW